MSGKTASPALGRRIAILDVGHGNCAIIYGGEAVVAIDTGPRGALLQFLLKEKITEIDAVYISHADKDHIGGLVQLLASRVAVVSAVYVNTDSLQGSAAWDDLVYELDHLDAQGSLKFQTSLTRDDTVEYDGGRTKIEILGPSKYLASRGPGSTDRNGKTITSNAISAVIRICSDGIPVLLLAADVDEIGLDDIQAHGGDLHARAVVFPHHGGLPGAGNLVNLTRRLWSMAGPTTVIFSIARGRAQHPRPELIQLIRKEWKNCRIACTQLTTHCAVQKPAADPQHLNPEFAAGRQERHCCAGTFTIDLDGNGPLLPTDTDHQAFITANAPTALCRASP